MQKQTCMTKFDSLYSCNLTPLIKGKRQLFGEDTDGVEDFTLTDNDSEIEEEEDTLYRHRASSPADLYMAE